MYDHQVPIRIDTVYDPHSCDKAVHHLRKRPLQAAIFGHRVDFKAMWQSKNHSYQFLPRKPGPHGVPLGMFLFFFVSGLRPVPQVSNTSSETRRSLEPERCRTNRADGPWGHGKGFIFHPKLKCTGGTKLK